MDGLPHRCDDLLSADKLISLDARTKVRPCDGMMIFHILSSVWNSAPRADKEL